MTRQSGEAVTPAGVEVAFQAPPLYVTDSTGIPAVAWPRTAQMMACPLLAVTVGLVSPPTTLLHQPSETPDRMIPARVEPRLPATVQRPQDREARDGRPACRSRRHVVVP